MDIKAINSAIMFGDLTNDELNSIVDAIKYRRANMQRQARWTFKVGQPVKFYSTKRNMPVTGTLSKIALKYATVSTTHGLWKVPMNMLEAA
jgi:hypothetical protein